MGRKSTHSYLTRFPEAMWPQIQQTAANNNCSVNELIVNTMGAMISSNNSVALTYSFASDLPIRAGGFTAQVYDFSQKEEKNS